MVYFYHQDKLHDEISSLRDDVQDLNHDDFQDNYDYDGEPTKVIEKKDEYTFQESQDRAILGVKYDASEKEIHQAYSDLRKKYNPHDSVENMKKFMEMRLAYKRLIKK
jgi:DnaJ-class molecular chaperone